MIKVKNFKDEKKRGEERRRRIQTRGNDLKNLHTIFATKLYELTINATETETKIYIEKHNKSIKFWLSTPLLTLTFLSNNMSLKGFPPPWSQTDLRLPRSPFTPVIENNTKSTLPHLLRHICPNLNRSNLLKSHDVLYSIGINGPWTGPQQFRLLVTRIHCL